MRSLQLVWRNFLNYAFSNPYGLIELLMLTLAIVLLAIWHLTDQWPYLTLSLSYGLGASLSILVRCHYWNYPQKLLSQWVAIINITLSMWLGATVMLG